MRLALVASAALILLAGCGQSPNFAASRAAAGLASRAAEGKDAKADFVAKAKSAGVKLDDAQLAVIQAERNVVPSGAWAPRPAEKLTAEQNLDVHFRKHGHEFRPALTSAEAYIKQGIASASGDRGEVRYFFDTTSFKKGYQSHVVRWVPRTHDFTAFRADGAETTYYQNDPKGNRFIEVPAW